MEILDTVFRHKNVVAFDAVELCPDERDIASSFTAARLVYKVMNYHAYYEQPGKKGGRRTAARRGGERGSKRASQSVPKRAARRQTRAQSSRPPARPKRASQRGR